MEIQFKATQSELEGITCNPIPSSKAIPEWYKRMSTHSGEEYSNKEKLNYYSNFGELKGGMTIKKCLPVRDMITAGYIIPLWSDIAVFCDHKKEQLQFNWKYQNSLIETHSRYQVRNSPIEKMCWGNQAFKLMNPWRIYTPKGYSSLFISPKYHDNGFIEILSGVVDTDEYHEVNLPFEYSGKEGRHVIPMGIPIAQVIPFKREEWSHNIEVLNETEEESHRLRLSSYLGGAYNKLFHKKKVFR